MQISKKKFGSVVATIAMVCILVGYFAANNLQLQSVFLSAKEKNPVTGHVRVWVNHGSGWELIADGENEVTYGGLHLIRDFLGFNNGSQTSYWFNDSGVTKVGYVGVSNASDAVSQSWTYLPGEVQWYEGFNRTLASNINTIAGNATAWNCTHTFTANATCASLQLAGLYWAGCGISGGNATLFAAKTFTSTTLYSADQLRIEWIVNCATG